MPGRQAVYDYLSGAEDMRRRELVWGMVREPAAPFWSHQEIVTRLTVLLYAHVRRHRLGRMCTSPVDVVLDEARALIVQPDVVFVSTERLNIVRNQVWGAPDLLVEVESTGTRRRDREWKRRWYRQYGVREYWLVDAIEQEVTVFSFPPSGRMRRRAHRGSARIASDVLPGLPVTVADVFDVNG